MAYTKTPMDNVEQTKRVPIFQQWETRNRTNAKDVDSVNVVWEVVKDPAGTYSVAIKRDGITTLVVGSPPPSEIYGMYYWTSFDSSYSPKIVLVGAFGVRLYNLNTNSLTSSDSSYSFLDTQIGFTEFQYDTGQIVVFISDGLRLYQCDGGGVLTQVTDPDFPTSHIPYPVYMDGYLFVGTYGGDIYNSDLNNPLSWSASNFISADAYPDRLLALARHGVYLVAFGESNIQYFYNAANPNGTPLAVYTASSPQVGFRGGLTVWGESLLFLGIARNGQQNIFKLEGFNLEPLGTAVLSRRIAKYNDASGFNQKGHVLAINGHNLYTWSSYTRAATPPSDFLESVYAIDLDTGLWTRLTYQNTDLFRIRCSAVCKNFLETYTMLTFYGDSILSKFDPVVTSDKNVDFTVQFVTKNDDFGTARMKFGSRALMVCDQTPSTSLMNISWTDDDYQTFSTPRTIDVSSTYPHLYALGSFRKRAWKVTYTSPFAMRWTGVELDYIQGQA